MTKLVLTKKKSGEISQIFHTRDKIEYNKGRLYVDAWLPCIWVVANVREGSISCPLGQYGEVMWRSAEEERSHEALDTVTVRKRQTSLTTSPNMLRMAVALCTSHYLAFAASYAFGVIVILKKKTTIKRNNFSTNLFLSPVAKLFRTSTTGQFYILFLRK